MPFPIDIVSYPEEYFDSKVERALHRDISHPVGHLAARISDALSQLLPGMPSEPSDWATDQTG